MNLNFPDGLLGLQWNAAEAPEGVRLELRELTDAD